MSIWIEPKASTARCTADFEVIVGERHDQCGNCRGCLGSDLLEGLGRLVDGFGLLPLLRGDLVSHHFRSRLGVFDLLMICSQITFVGTDPG